MRDDDYATLSFDKISDCVEQYFVESSYTYRISHIQMSNQGLEFQVRGTEAFKNWFDYIQHRCITPEPESRLKMALCDISIEYKRDVTKFKDVWPQSISVSLNQFNQVCHTVSIVFDNVCVPNNRVYKVDVSGLSLSTAKEVVTVAQKKAMADEQLRLVERKKREEEEKKTEELKKIVDDLDKELAMSAMEDWDRRFQESLKRGLDSDK